jgi:hypothetical protein
MLYACHKDLSCPGPIPCLEIEVPAQPGLLVRSSVPMLACACFLTAASALPDGRIGVLYVGCLARSEPFQGMTVDPLFSIEFVPATYRDWVEAAGLTIADERRMIRIYMPRTTEALLDRIDVVVLANANRDAIGPRNVDLLYRGFQEADLGLFMSGGWESFGGGGPEYPAWDGTSIGSLLPVEGVPETWPQLGRLVIDRPDHELVSSLPWDSRALDYPDRWDHNIVTVRGGATQLAHLLWAPGLEHPLMITWELEGRNRVFALTSEIHRLSWYDVPWEYDYDFGCNIMIYLDRRAVPQDIDIVHLARSEMLAIAGRKSYLMDILEFSESFGANTGAIRSRFGEVDEVMARASEQYIDLRYEDMLETNELIVTLLEELQAEAMELKDRALTWVYLIEWLSVTFTALVCAFVLWTVMVRRRLYREVNVTRAW